MSESITKEELYKGLAGAGVAIVIVTALLIFNAPVRNVYAGYQTTQTVTAVSIQTNIVTSTQAVISTVLSTITSTLVTASITSVTTTVPVGTVTATTTQTVTLTSTSSQTFPGLVTVSGSVTLSSLLNAYTPTDIKFVSGSSAQTFPVTNGKYAATLTNLMSYQVTIDYSFGPAAGSCNAGNLPLNAVGPITESWSC